MITKYNVGDNVCLYGRITRSEILPGNTVVYYLNEAPGLAILEKDIHRTCDPSGISHQYVELNMDSDKVLDKIKEYVELLKKARSVAADLADAKIHLDFCLDNDGERSPTVLASVFTDSDNE